MVRLSAETAGLQFAHFEADQYFVGTDGVYNWNPAGLGRAHEWCQLKTAEHLTMGYIVVVSNTFTTRKELRPYFDMVHEILGEDPNVILMQSNFGNVHGVNDEVLEKMKGRFVYDISDMYMYK
jgi:hypothetical protein